MHNDRQARGTESRIGVLRALAALLTYPCPGLLAALPEIRVALDREYRLKPTLRAALGVLPDELAAGDLLDLQERYVELFDRGRATALHLFEHVHGDSRERGTAMVDLRALYARAGLQLRGRELPDYLPAVLEYLSTRPPAEVRDMLADCAHILRAVGLALVARGSSYAAIFDALLVLAGEVQLDRASVAPPDREHELRELDLAWVEQPVLFGLGRGDARGDVFPLQFRKRTH